LDEHDILGSAVKGLDFQVLLAPLEKELSGKGLARCLAVFPVRFQPLPIGTAREVFPQAARPVVFSERVMGHSDAGSHFNEYVRELGKGWIFQPQKRPSTL
jgi:hypothetical protein